MRAFPLRPKPLYIKYMSNYTYPLTNTYEKINQKRYPMAVLEESLTAPRRPGFLSTLAGVIARPRRTFEALREHDGRGWLLMALIALVFAVLPVIVSAPLSVEETRQAIQAQLDTQAQQNGALPASTQEQAMQFATNPVFTVVFPTVAGLVGLALTWLIWAGGLHLLGTILGGSSSFGQMLRMVVWSWLPYTLRGLLQTVYILATGTLIRYPGLSGLVADRRPAAEIIANPAGMGQQILQNLMGRVDLYLFWNLGLLITGTIVTARISGRKGWLITLGVWVLLTLLALLPTLAAGAFTSGLTGG